MSLALALACIASVHDGDTLRLCSGERIRLARIDAPEMPGSPACRYNPRAWCGDWTLAYRSRDALRSFAARGNCTIRRVEIDRHRRTVAIVTCNGADAGQWLVRRGLAKTWSKGR